MQKNWIFVSPENTSIPIKGGFGKFRKEHGLSISKMREIAHFKTEDRFHKGWTVWLKEGYYEDGLWIKK